jgi:hypothetical protein
VSRSVGRLGCSTGAQRISLLLTSHPPSRNPAALRSSLKERLHSPLGARAPTRRHCSNRSNASPREAQACDLAAYSQKKWSQELFLRRLGRTRITESRRGFFAGCASEKIGHALLATHQGRFLPILLPHHLRAGSHSPARVVLRRAFHLNSMLHQNYKVCTKITNACRTRRPALPPSRSRTMGTLQRCAPPSTGSAEANPQRNQLDVGPMPQTHSRSLGTGTRWACALF